MTILLVTTISHLPAQFSFSYGHLELNSRNEQIKTNATCCYIIIITPDIISKTLLKFVIYRN